VKAKAIHLLIIYLALAGILNVRAQEPPSLVRWLSFKEAFELNKKQPKPFIIDIYTDWCGWCKQMMKTTYSNPEIANYLNTWFYPVKFDAETKDSIEYLGTTYYNTQKTGKSTHPLAKKLLGNQLMYPSTIFTNYTVNFSLNSQGYLDIKKMEPMMIYTVENVFRTTPFEDFKKNFEKAFYDTTKPKTELQWLNFNQAISLAKKHPRKLLVVIYTSWCNACRVMNKTTFSDSLNADYINKNYYLVDFNAESKDTIQYLDKKYLNNQDNGTPFHQLAMNLAKNNLSLPSTVIIDENFATLDLIPQYLSPKVLEPVLRFYGDDAYKKEKWEDFQKKFKNKK